MLEPVELEFRVKDADLEQGSKRIVDRIVNIDEEAMILIKRLEALEEKFRELAGQPVMPGVEEQMTDIRTEIDQIGGSLRQMVDGAVTVGINEVAEGMRQVAEAGEGASKSIGKFAENISDFSHEELVGMFDDLIKKRDELLASGKDKESDLIKGMNKEIVAVMDALDALEGKAEKATTGLSGGFDKASRAAGSLGKMMTGSLYMIAAQAVAGLAVAIYKLATELTDLEKAMQRVDKGFVDFFENLNKERASVDDLFNKLRNAREGTQAYESAKDSIISQYGKYLKGMSDEIQSLQDMEGAYKAVSAAVIQSARDRAMAEGKESALSVYNKAESKQLTTIMEAFKKTSPEHYNSILDELKQSIDNGTELTDRVKQEIEKFTTQATTMQSSAGAFSFAGGNKVKDALNEIIKARQTYEEERKRVFDLYSAPPDDSEVKRNFDYWSKELKQLEEQRRDLSSGDVGGEEWKRLTTEIEAARKEVEKYSDAKAAPDRHSARTDERQFGQEQQRLRRIAELQRRMREQEVAGELETQAAIIATMEEGVEKELAQIALNYERRKMEVAKWGDELIRQQQEIERAIWENENPDWQQKGITYTPQTTSIEQLSDNQRRLIEDMAFLAEEVKRQSIERLSKLDEQYRNEYMKDYGDYYDKLAAINREYTEKIAAESNEWKKKSLTGQWKKELAELEKEMIQKSHVWEVLMSDLSGIGSKMIQEYVDNAEKLLSESENLTVQEIEAMKRALDNAKRTIAEKNPFEMMFQSYKKYREALKNGSTQDAANYFSQFEAAANKVTSIISEITSTTSGLAGLFSQDAAKALQDLGGILNSVVNAVKGFSSGDKISSITGIISAVTTVLGGIVDAFESSSKAQKEYLEYMERFENRMFLMLHSIRKEDYENIFGIDVISMSIDSWKNIIDVSRQYQDAVKGNSVALDRMYNDKKWGEINKLMMREKGYDGLEALPIITKQANWLQKWWGTGDEIKSLRDFAPELWTDGVFDPEKARLFLETNKEINKEVNSAQREAIENAIVLDEKYNELLGLIRDELKDTFGYLGNALTDHIINAIKSGSDAWDDFKNIGAQAIETLGKKLMYNLFLDKAFKDLQTRLNDSYNDITDAEQLANTQAAILDDFFNGLTGTIETAQSWAEEWRRKMAEYGFDIWGMDDPFNQKKEVGGFQTLSQQTGYDLLGQFTAFRIHAGDLVRLVSDMYIDWDKFTPYLRGIMDNTFNTVAQLKTLNERVKRIEVEGIKVA